MKTQLVLKRFFPDIHFQDKINYLPKGVRKLYSAVFLDLMSIFHPPEKKLQYT